MTDERIVPATPTPAAPAAPAPAITLNDGRSIPQIGAGVLRIDNGDVARVVQNALEVGYRHIDTAAGYGNEDGVGRGLAEAGFATGENRERLWLTTKLRDSEQGYDSARKAFDRQLALLRTDYVDMYMIHWPTPFDWRSEETWRAFTELRADGRVKTLGVCNFMPSDLDRLYAEVGEYPAVNQIELHPTFQQRDVVEYCRDHGIAVQAYSPMARGADLTAGGAELENIAKNHQATVAQIILAWHLQNGTIIIPKSVHRDRLAENLASAQITLTSQDIAFLDSLNTQTRAGHDPATFSYS
ncbi:aldo/keto reductase [Alloscardovia macacae]|uniref:2,5-diketo-D-gluconic acid reductase n=1 Tax=Alloscardovia macacae TaxID=1160091 RepID=A0A261F612_9BIFI|nr:aldo/keto reductase [Alloscardovia macacae]OZG54577.1 2,5-diketo-D-gluconic acid reductase [Alloscardovia macacae]